MFRLRRFPLRVFHAVTSTGLGAVDSAFGYVIIVVVLSVQPGRSDR